MTPLERYKTDATFAALVRNFYDMFQHHCGTGAGITPSEVREASGLAWQMYVERNAVGIPVIKPPDLY
jgi:hypothetical protein